MIALYHQTKTSIGFLCRWELNSRFLIQPSEILLVELTKTHIKDNYTDKRMNYTHKYDTKLSQQQDESN